MAYFASSRLIVCRCWFVRDLASGRYMSIAGSPVSFTDKKPGQLGELIKFQASVSISNLAYQETSNKFVVRMCMK